MATITEVAHEVPVDPSKFSKLPHDILNSRAGSDRAKLFYAKVCQYAWEALDSWCSRTQPGLASDLGWSRRKAQMAARECLDLGWLEVRRTGRVNSYRPAAVRGDAQKVAHQMRKGLRREVDDPKQTTRTSQVPVEPKESGSSSARGETETATTTTTSQSSPGMDDGSIAADLLDAYDGIVFDRTGRRPTREPRDRQAALDLAPAIRAEATDDDDLARWPTQSFDSVVEWGMHDPYSRQRLLNGFASAAKCYRAIAVQYAAAPTVRCQGCSEVFVAGAEMQKRITQHGDMAELVCPDCEAPAA